MSKNLYMILILSYYLVNIDTALAFMELFETQVHFLTVWTWATYLASLHLSFVLCKMELKLLFHRLVKIKRDDA